MVTLIRRHHTSLPPGHGRISPSHFLIVIVIVIVIAIAIELGLTSALAVVLLGQSARLSATRLIHIPMPTAAKRFFLRWAITTLGVLAAANMVPGIRYDTVAGLLLASLLLGILNAVIRPVMMILALPLLLVTLGLFVFVINGLLLYTVGSVLKSFHVDSFWAAFLGALVISVVSMFANALLGTGGNNVEVRHHRRPPPPGPPGGKGPIIDV